MYNLSTAGHMERFNAGDRATQPRQPSIYEQTLPEKLATLERLQADCDRGSINPDPFQPYLQGQIGTTQVKVRCAYNDAQRIAIDLQGLTPEQALRVLATLQGE